MKETIRAFNKLDRSLTKDVQKGLKKAAEPVAVLAREKLSRFRGASLATINPRAAGASVFVTQRAKKVTGRRGDFGALQMTQGLMPALDERQDEVLHAVEDALEDWANNF